MNYIIFHGNEHFYGKCEKFVFIFVSALTRGCIFFILAGVIRFFGKKIVPYIEKRSIKILIIMSILLLIGFGIAYLIYQNYEHFLK